MLYVPIQIYPNNLSLKGCIVFAALWLTLALAAYAFIPIPNVNVAVYGICMVGFAVSMIKCFAVMRKRPMIKVLDDRFSVYTPFGYAMIRFGEVLEFKRGRFLLMETLHVVINTASRPRFATGLSRTLYAVCGMKFSNTVSIPGYMLGMDPESLVKMLDKRRLSAVRLEAAGGYDTTALVSVAE